MRLGPLRITSSKRPHPLNAILIFSEIASNLRGNYNGPVYGLVNKSLCTFLRGYEGGDALIRQLAKAGTIPELGFETYENYDDAVTFQIVGAACEQLHIAPKDVLNDFGRHWIAVVAPSFFPALVELAGATFGSFLNALNLIHDRGHAMFPDYQPPSFRVEGDWESSGEVKVYYVSHREGLEEFMRGLLLGIGERYQVKLQIEIGDPDPVTGEICFALAQ
jgi:hypothetical protein